MQINDARGSKQPKRSSESEAKGAAVETLSAFGANGGKAVAASSASGATSASGARSAVALPPKMGPLAQGAPE